MTKGYECGMMPPSLALAACQCADCVRGALRLHHWGAARTTFWEARTCEPDHARKEASYQYSMD